ncbi:putative transporter [Salmonella enterica subsp. enterica serovar Gaminara str. ATCC BAA-711]|nr:putative transporter [Salmonella enterica subsp. enterica serovar Gaminara str. ATCC BAA-711]
MTRSVAASEGKNAAIWSPSVLLRDKALLWFTLSAFLASFVGGRLCVLYLTVRYGRCR